MIGTTILFIILFWGIFFATMKLTQRFHKREWVEHGREWRDNGWPRFCSNYKWIQRYFDMGYDEPK